MSITSTIYSEFVEGTSFEELYHKHKRSSSALYTAWRKFVTIKSKELTDIQNELPRTKAELERVQAEAKVTEAKQMSYGRQVVELKKLLKSLRDEEQVALGVLEQFRKMGLAPTVALELLKKDKDLDAAITWKKARSEALERKAGELEQRTKDMKENHDGWRWRRDAVMEETTREEAKLKWLVQNKQGELDTISSYINNMETEHDKLEPRVVDLRAEAAGLSDRIRKMRSRIPKLSFIDDQLQAEVTGLGAEVEDLKRKRDELRATLQRTIEAEAARGHRVDIEFSTKTEALKTSYEQLIAQGDAETEKTIKQRVGDRLERLPVELERCADITIQLVALGTQRSMMIDELEELNGRRLAVTNPLGYVTAPY